MDTAFKFAEKIRQEVSVREFVPYVSQITENIIKTDAGDYLFCLRLSGISHQSADNTDMNSWHEQLNALMRNVASPKVAFWSHIVRHRFNTYPGGKYSPGFASDLNDHYRAKMQDAVLRINELFITVVYRPEPVKASGFLDNLLTVKIDDIVQREETRIEEVKSLMQTVLTGLDRYAPTLLGCYEHKGRMFSEVAEFLGMLLNGFWQRIPLARAQLRDVLPTSRQFFVRSGDIALKMPTDTRYGAILSIQEYPAHTYTGIFDGLLSVPFDYVIGQSFTFLSKASAKAKMIMQRSRLINAGDVAKSQIADIDTALDDITANRFSFGAHSFAMLVFGRDDRNLKENISLTGTILSDEGIKWTREDIGCAAAFWSLLPGNFKYRIRTSDISSLNFAGFSALHNFPSGRFNGNQWGPAVTMFKTVSGAPFYFSFHKGEDGADNRQAAKIDPNHKELANTIVIGKSGSGKTVLENFLMSQLQKFNQPDQPLTCVVFDKDLGASIAVRALGGCYLALKTGESSGFNPMQLEPTPKNLAFLEQLICYLARPTKSGEELSASERTEIAHAVSGVMSPAVAKEKRRLRSVYEFLDKSKADGVAARLSRYVRGFGSLGWLFDNAQDQLVIDDCPIFGFDMTEFLDNAETRTPLTMYLMHRLESLFDGRRVVFFMDEFWKLLDDEVFTDFAKNKLVTIRKQNGFLVMFTQSPQQILQSKIAFAIIEQTATKIFLPNPSADEKDYTEGFKLSHIEFDIVRSLPEKSRRFLIKQGINSVVAELDLRGFNDELAVLSSNTSTSLLVEKLTREYGDDPSVWLPPFFDKLHDVAVPD